MAVADLNNQKTEIFCLAQVLDYCITGFTDLHNHYAFDCV